LTYFIKEVSRFYPPANDIFPKFSPVHIKIGEFVFPKNTYFGIGIKTIMNDPEVFINPSEFKP
jgi:cytochrome P450